MEEPADDDDPAYVTLFSGEDVIHAVLSNGVGMATPYAGAVPPPAAGTGGNAAATSYTNLWQFVDKVALKVGMTQANLVEDFDMRREPGAFHGVRQHTAALFENELDRYSWVLGGGAHGGEAIYDSPDWSRLGDHGAEESWALPVGGSFPHVSHPSQSMHRPNPIVLSFACRMYLECLSHTPLLSFVVVFLV